MTDQHIHYRQSGVELLDENWCQWCDSQRRQDRDKDEYDLIGEDNCLPSWALVLTVLVSLIHQT